jgi:hypothetical protein
VYRFFSALFAVVVISAFCAGQSKPVDVFAGFSYVTQDFSLTSDSGGLTGWNASATFPAAPRIGVVTDFSGYYPGFNPGCNGCGQHAKIHTFLVGPQFSASRGRVTPFARFLLGDTHMSTAIDSLPNYITFTSNNSFTFGGGGGVDVRVSRRFALRGQADWLHNGFQTTDNQRRNEEIHNVARLSVGIVLHLGGARD